MADIAKSGTPSYSSLVPPQSGTIAGINAAEAIGAGDACYVSDESGVARIRKCSAATAGAAASCDGFAFTDAPSGEAVTLVDHGNFRYGAGLTPGTLLYLSAATAGALADAAVAGNRIPVAKVLDATRIRILRSGLGVRSGAKNLSNTATWDPANVADGAQTTTTITVTGAALGDIADASFSLDLQGLQMTAYVSAANTVTVVLRNGTGGAVNLASGTLRADVR